MSRGMTACPWPSMLWNRRIKSSGLKWAEHNLDVAVGSHFARFAFTNSTHCCLLLLAIGRSSPQNGKAWSTIPSSTFGKLPQCPATHLFGILIKLCLATRTSLDLSLQITVQSGDAQTVWSYVDVTDQLVSDSFSIKKSSAVAHNLPRFQTSLRDKIWQGWKISILFSLLNSN